jgi:hypothetical protein
MRLSKYCNDYKKIENYQIAESENFQGWVLHHRLEVDEISGIFRNTQMDLKRKNLYYHRPPEELILLRVYDHKSLHARSKNPFLGARGMVIKERAEVSKNFNSFIFLDRFIFC